MEHAQRMSHFVIKKILSSSTSEIRKENGLDNYE